MGWHVAKVDGHDPDAVAAAIEAAIQVEDRPSIIACRTVIGQGSPSYEGTARTHGAALGEDEVRATKERLGMNPDATFDVPTDVVEAFRACASTEVRQAWEARLAEHADGERYRDWLQPNWTELVEKVDWPDFETGTKLATRKASAACLKALAAAVPNFIGGSADLAGSNGTAIGATSFTPQKFAGAHTLHFGVREHAAASVCNGIVLHGGLRPFTATFLAFHDYQRPAVRLSALMHQPVVYIYTHDSVFLGEDGPTHQPVSTLLALRSLPGIEVWRPADAAETRVSWQQTLLRVNGPSALILTRQGLPVVDRREFGAVEGAAQGGYILLDSPDGPPEVVLIGTGSEVPLCVEAQRVLADRGVRARVVSMPCRERFLEQDDAYRETVLPTGVRRVSVEAAVTLGWERWIGQDGVAIGIDRYGASAPASVLADKFGFTAERIASVATAVARPA